MDQFASSAGASRAPALSEWRDNWHVLLPSVVGVALTTVYVYSIGLFFEPLENQFGWSRSQVALGLTIHAVISVPLMPVFGVLIDRYGPRRIAIPGVILYGICFACFALTPGPLAIWLGQWALLALISLMIKPTVWVIAVSSRFSRAKGLAMAITLSGTALSSSIVPLFAHRLIESYGWQIAYLVLGLGWAGFALLLVLPFFHDAQDRAGRSALAAPRASAERERLPGLTFREAMRDRNFIKVALASLLASLTVMSTTVHLFPILTMRGLDRATAAEVLTVLGIASLLGKLLTGWLFDRLDARRISAFLLLIPLLPMFYLAHSSASEIIPVWLAVTVIALIGFTAGAELSMTAYLTTRYVGLRSFGQNYGIITSVMALTAGIGPPLAGYVYDQTGSYSLWLYGILPCTVAASVLVMTLGRFPQWESELPGASEARP